MENLVITDSKWMEIKSRTDQVKKAVENELSRHYSFHDEQNKKRIFNSEKCGDFYICAMGNEEPWNFLVIAYREEDGYSFYPSDYDNFDSLISDMISEIEAM